jgi:hypothetical protein
MAYYPKSQIITNLYTSGGEYSLTPNNISQPQDFYIGPYYKISSGKLYTGKTPEDGPSSLLYQVLPTQYDGEIQSPYKGTKYISIPIDTSDDSSNIKLEYINLKNISSTLSRTLPSPTQTLPTQKDKDLGSFPRYFCKKNNENLYIEINKEQFTKLQNRDKTIASDLFTPLQIIWQIKGDKIQTSNTNKTNITLIEQRNKWYGFTKYFKDNFLKYYLES